MKKYKKLIISIVIFITASVSVLFFFLAPGISFDHDTIWHYLMGRDVLKMGLSTRNPYTWVSADTRWNQQEWLFGVFEYLILKTLGSAGLPLSYLLAMGSLVLASAWNDNFRSRLPYYYIPVIAVNAGALFPHVLPGRPAVLSTVMLPFLLVLYKKTVFKEHEDVIKFILINFMCGILLANLHAGQGLIILAFLTAMAVFEACYGFLFSEVRKNILVTRITGITSLTMGLCYNMANGPRVYADMIKCMGDSTTKLIQEWNPASFGSYKAAASICLLLSISAFCLARNITRERVMAEACIILSAVLMLHTVKASIVFTYTYSVFALELIKGADTRIEEFISRERKALISTKLFVAALGAGAVMSALIYMHEGISYDDLVRKFQKEVIDDEMIEAIRENGGRLIHGYDISNYLMWNDIKVFVDTRQQPYMSDLYGVRSMNDALVIGFSGRPDDIKESLERYDYDLVLTGDALNTDWYFYDNDEYELIYRDTKNNALYRRK